MTALLKLKERNSLPQTEIELTSQKDGTSTLQLEGKDYVKFFFDHRDEIESLLDCNFVNSNAIQIAAKPEAFGLIRWSDKTIYVYPKFLSTNNKIDFDLLTSLFFVIDEKEPDIFHDTSAKQTREDFSNFFDFYFFNVLKQIAKFLKQYSRVEFTTEEKEISGIKGRIKIEESIRRFGGLNHKTICEVGAIERNAILFGVLKNLTKKILKLSSNEKLNALGLRIISDLNGFKEVDVTKQNLDKLEAVSARVKRESKRIKSMYASIMQTLLFVTSRSNTFSSVSFSFDMDTQYETLVRIFLEQFLDAKFKVHSGNNKPEVLLGCNSRNVIVEDDSASTSTAAGVVRIKPDLIISADNEAFCVCDTKYKMLKVKRVKDSNKILGVKSSDIQQILTYWTHFTDKGSKAPNVNLIYPMPDSTELNSELVKVIGSVSLNVEKLKIRGQKRIEIGIIGISIQLLLKGLSDRKANAAELSAAALKLVG